MSPPLPALEEARTLLAGARRVCVLTGAGISAESGVPTFRGKEGLWRNHDPMTLATPRAFAEDPQLVWEWYDWRRSLVLACTPNEGHRALVRLEERVERCDIVTQNVDGLHRAAGSTRVHELHGQLFVNRCTACDRQREVRSSGLDGLPHCSACGVLERPGVVWFGEALPHEPWAAASQAMTTSDLVLVVGTSALVYPAAQFVPTARAADVPIIVVNPERTDHVALADHHLAGPAGQVLPLLID